VKNFSEYIDDYDNGGQQIKNYPETHISFSPTVVSGGSLNILPLENWEISFPFKAVSRQYLDNTSDKNRSLNGFYIQDFKTVYTVSGKRNFKADFIFQLNNILGNRYEPNGYTFSYIYGGQLTTENYYFPMAGRNFMMTVNLKF
jgi:iron complex outermembrane receptor protein